MDLNISFKGHWNALVEDVSMRKYSKMGERDMEKIVSNLWFDEQAEEAVGFYVVSVYKVRLVSAARHKRRSTITGISFQKGESLGSVDG